MNNLENIPSVGEITFRGRTLPTKITDLITSVEIDMAVDQVTELTFTFDDPEFNVLKTGIFDLKTQVKYRGLDLVVAVIETNAGGGLGGFGIRCRPRSVQKLKELRGNFVLQNVSPATYVKNECKKAGLTLEPLTQASPAKKRIARDVREKGVTYDASSQPSAWTTFQRLAGELGYMMYEIGGRIYFGKPTWLVQKQPKVEVAWYPENGKEPYTIPEFRQSIDNEDIEITMELPIQRAGLVYPGVGLKVTGYPKYAGTYFIKSVNYPLVGVGNVTINASTIRNPKPQKGGEEDGGGGNGNGGRGNKPAGGGKWYWDEEFDMWRKR